MSESEIAISIKSLSKHFSIERTKPRKDSLRELFSKQKHVEPLPTTNTRISGTEFKALSNVTFDVKRGETLGIIGANGAGKSTLLKVLSHILKPTTGEFTIRGRVSSLLEVGTGFHPELSGRENVYFNGSLLGMTRSEITEKFDEIVDFAELSDFIDTPIKYYSTGMRARLGFSIAATLDAEIMIVDEALAVGDAAFRKKAMERMRETALSGKTVLFVTHSLSFIQESCDRCVLLKDGELVMIDEPDAVIDTYLAQQEEEASTSWRAGKKREGDKRISIKSMFLHANGVGMKSQSVTYKDDLSIVLSYQTDRDSDTYSLGYQLIDDQGRRLWRMAHPEVKKKIELAIPTKILRPGKYFIAADADVKNDKWVINPNKTAARVSFTITDSRDDIWDKRREGVIKPPFTAAKS